MKHKITLLLVLAILLTCCSCANTSTQPPKITLNWSFPSPTAVPTVSEPTATPAPSADVPSTDKIDKSALQNIDGSVKGTWSATFDKNTGRPIFDARLKAILDKYGAHYIGDENEKTIYLTFTAGYEAGYTGQILDILKKYEIPATFFILKWYAVSAPELTQRIIDEGHNLGNHTLSHKQLTNESIDTIVSEIGTMHDYIKENFGYDMLYFRPSYNMFDERVIAAAGMMGYKISLWSLAYVDWGTDRGKEYAYHSVINSLHNGCVINLHATYQSNATALESIIQEALARGYTFAPLP